MKGLFLVGIFIQGGFVLISAAMLRSREFGKATAFTGILANGLDFAHVFVALVAPAIGVILLSIGSLFYLPLLGRDLVRLGQGKTGVR